MDRNLNLIEICADLYSEVDHLRGENLLGGGVLLVLGIVGHGRNTDLDPVWVVADNYPIIILMSFWIRC